MAAMPICGKTLFRNKSPIILYAPSMGAKCINVLGHMSRVVIKPAFYICENKETKTQISFAVTAKLISAFVFAIGIVQSLYYIHPKFQASNHLRWLYKPVCVGPGRKPRRPVFSQRGSYDEGGCHVHLCYKHLKSSTSESEIY